MIWPDWQYPHWITSRSSHAFCTLAPTGVAPTPSIVVTAFLPIDPIGSRHERTGLPSIWTVQTPHCAMPQPNFVPVIPSTSRNTQSSGTSSDASTVLSSPLIFSVAMASLPFGVTVGLRHPAINQCHFHTHIRLGTMQAHASGATGDDCEASVQSANVPLPRGSY